MADPYTRGQAQNLVTILALDPVHGKIVAQLLEPELLEGPLRLIAERCSKFWKDYKTCPGQAHLADLFTDITDKPDSRQATAYKRILRQMAVLSEGVNTEYVVRTLKATSRRQKMKSVLLKVAEIAQAENLDLQEGEDLLAEFLRAREFQFDAGTRLKDVDKVLDFLDQHFNEFSTGVEQLDKKNVVPARGAVLFFLAPTRRGKSWWLVNLGKQALLQRKNVLHITLEMGEEETMQRYYQALFSIPKHPEDIEIFELDTDEHGRFEHAKSEVIKPKVSFESKNIRKFLRKSINRNLVQRMSERLIVKRFAPRSLTCNQLRAYLDTLEAANGWVPDLIVLDYIGIMATDANNHRISLGRVMEDFRAVCIERNAAGATAGQSSKAGEESFQVKITHVAEDWSLIGTADIAVTFSQTSAERARGLARLWVDKCRGEADNWGVVVTQAYALGQFVLQSAPLGKAYTDYAQSLEKRAKDDDDDDGDEEE